MYRKPPLRAVEEAISEVLKPAKEKKSAYASNIRA
jgi:hypothetical protein